MKFYKLRYKDPNYHKNYYKTNAKKRCKYMKGYYKKHRRKMLTQMKKTRQQNLEKCRQQDRQYYYKQSSRYNDSKSAAKQRNIPFQLSKIEYYNLISQPCTYCFKSLETEGGIGLDRIDNSKTIGYTVLNVLPCCGLCNMIRRNVYNIEEMKIIGRKVRDGLEEYWNQKKA